MNSKNTETKGLVHIYTGEGKGKTTASVGLAVRALGHGLNVVYSSFLKRSGLYGYTEIDMLEKLGAKVYTFTNGHPNFQKGLSNNDVKDDLNKALAELTTLINSNQTDLLVMDEILIALNGFIGEQDLLDFIKSKPESCELVLTGRGATDGIMEVADYVSDINKIKHPYDMGVLSRKGIEY